MRRTVSFLTLICFLLTAFGPVPAYAQSPEGFSLSMPGKMVTLSPSFSPAVLKGIKLDPKDPFQFHFYVDVGDGSPVPKKGEETSTLQQESQKLIKYFLASLTIPEKDLWVNLSPYEKNRVVPQEFGQTEMGRDLLAQDYLLKQITASLIYPEGELGKKFWQKVYKLAQEKYGTSRIPVNTFNKVWIVPDKAVVYENNGVAFVLENHLKVMLEEDYLSLEKNTTTRGHVPTEITKNVSLSTLPTDQPLNVKATQGTERTPNETNQIGSQIIRDIVIPELTKEVNEGKNFAQLRQVFYSLILATWYKKKIKDSILNKVFANQNKIGGVNVSSQDKEIIYQQYLQAFKKGVYNYIKEEPDPITGQNIPRKYFSGGVNALEVSKAMTSVGPSQISLAQRAGLDKAQLVDVNGDFSLRKTGDTAQLSQGELAQKIESLYTLDSAKAQTLAGIIKTETLTEIRNDDGSVLLTRSSGEKLIEISSLDNLRFFDLNGRWILSVDRFGNMTDQLKWNEQDSFVEAKFLNGNRLPLNLGGDPRSKYIRVFEDGEMLHHVIAIESKRDVLNNAGEIPTATGAEFTLSKEKGGGVGAVNIFSQLALDRKNDLRYVGNEPLIFIESSLNEVGVLREEDRDKDFQREYFDMKWSPDPLERMFNPNSQDGNDSRWVYVAWAPKRKTMMRVWYKGEYFYNQEHLLNNKLVTGLRGINVVADMLGGIKHKTVPSPNRRAIIEKDGNFELWLDEGQHVAVIDKFGNIIEEKEDSAQLSVQEKIAQMVDDTGKPLLILEESTGRIRLNPEAKVVSLLFNLLYARHGQTQANEEGRLQGLINDSQNGLNETGRSQAELLADELMKDQEIREAIELKKEIVVITSQMKRTDETSSPFRVKFTAQGGLIDVSPIAEGIKASVNEMSSGALENMTEAEARSTPEGRAFREGYKDRLDATVRPPGNGESYVDMVFRVYQWIKQLNQLYKDKTVVVFGHGAHQTALGILLGQQGFSSADGWLNWNVNRLENAKHIKFLKTTDAAMNTVVTLPDAERIRREIFEQGHLSDESKRDIRSLYTEGMFKLMKWQYAKVDDIPVEVRRTIERSEQVIAINQDHNHLGTTTDYFSFTLTAEEETLWVGVGAFGNYPEAFTDPRINQLSTHKKLFWWMEHRLKAFAKKLGFKKIAVSMITGLTDTEMHSVGYEKFESDRSNSWAQPVDAAMSSGPGGIDLNPNQMNMSVRTEGQDFKFNFNGVEINASQITGANFTIRMMTPVVNLHELLGIS